MYWIWIKVYDNGTHVASMRSAKWYARRGNAERVARDYWKSFGGITYETTVSESNPFKEEST